MPSVVIHRSRKLAVLALVAMAALATEGCSTLRRRAAERPPYRKVSPPIAYEMIRDTPGILILDLRPAQAFHGDTGHIYRAYNIPEDRLPFRLLELSSFREETFLVYCDTEKCGDDGMGVLVSSGFENALLIDGGIESWIAKGFRTVLPEELAGRRQQVARQGEPEKSGGGAGPSPRPTAQPALLQRETTGGTTLPAMCLEPHVAIQGPPR